MKFVASILFSLLFLVAPATEKKVDIPINFHALWNNNTLELNKKLKLNDTATIEFENFKFYVSAIELYQNNKLVFKEQNSFHLIDFSDSASLFIHLTSEKKINYNQIKFNIGIDSITNVSGAMGGDLDPTKGMYWTWQSGYINLKLEGKSNLCKTRGNDFFYHLGGYAHPFNTLQTVILQTKKTKEINININVNTFFSAIDIKKTNQIMSPNKDAVFISKQVAQLFSIQ